MGVILPPSPCRGMLGGGCGACRFNTACLLALGACDWRPGRLRERNRAAAGLWCLLPQLCTPDMAWVPAVGGRAGCA